MEKIKLNYSILVSIKINKETILEICNAETNIVSFFDVREFLASSYISYKQKTNRLFFCHSEENSFVFIFIFLKSSIHIGIFWFIDFGKAVDFQGWEVLFEFFMVVIDQFSLGCYPGVILILTGISLGQQSIDT